MLILKGEIIVGKGNKKKKLAKKSIKILSSGKIKFAKDQKIDISEMVNDSVDRAIVSRLDGIISREDVVVNPSGLKLETNINLLPISKSLTHSVKIEPDKIQTVVITIPKKAALDAFDLSYDTELGEMLRRSTLAPAYTRLKEEWVKLNEDDKSHFTNVMFVPNVTVFLDEYGQFLNRKFNINVLILAIPNKKNMSSEPGDVYELPDVRRRVVADMMEAAIRCGAKNLIVDPHGYNALAKDLQDTSLLWKEAIGTQRVIEQIRSITFAIDDEEKYYLLHNTIV